MPGVASRTVLGYELLEHIGSGGYGEVWKAMAPGGISKAVKIIFGRFDGDRANRELTALNRIKEVRHPFLLSLERIEVVDGQLVIITELADMCLKDRFDACRRCGLQGIPHDELLSLLWDAAEVLDYLCEKHSLQHLDIKPENLLLVAGRVKVADFGLVKQLNDANVSMMGGLTPTYSAPELFEGTPSRQSDQYSLAIVYYQMLTGALPFDGTTPARLTMQHLQAVPCLDGLPPGDRVAVERALSKEPHRRFPSCRQLIDQLARGETAAAEQSSGIPTGGPRHSTAVRHSAAPPAKLDAGLPVGSNWETPAASPAINTLVLEGDSIEDFASADARLGASQLEPLGLLQHEAALRPTLLVGIGGTGAEILRSVARRLESHCGDLDKARAVQFLLVDTDVRSLAASGSDARGGAKDLTSLALPLRRVQEYRLRPPGVVRWLDRRWLYSIPRSLETGRLRPLGRLALVDHAPTVLEHLDAVLRQMMDSDGIESTARALKAPFLSDSPQVFLVASISGGTGGGMIIDMAYAVHAVLQSLGLAQSAVHGILTCSSGSRTEEEGLALANAYACLTELNHYERPDTRYPGNPDCGLPTSCDNRPPFHSTRLVHFGDAVDDGQYRVAIERTADYLYLHVATMAGPLLEKSRLSSRTNAGTATLGTFAAAVLADFRSELAAAASDLISMGVVRRWLGTAPAEVTKTAYCAAGPSKPSSLDSILGQTFGRGADPLFLHRLREFLQEYLVQRTQEVQRPEEATAVAQLRFAQAVRQAETLKESFEQIISRAVQGDVAAAENLARRTGSKSLAAVRGAFLDAIRLRAAELAAEVEGKVLPVLFARPAELSAAIDAGGELATFFDEALGFAARAAAARCLTGLEPVGTLLAGRSPSEATQLLADCLAETGATPLETAEKGDRHSLFQQSPLHCAGYRRLVVLLPEGWDADRLRDLLPAEMANCASFGSDRSATWAFLSETVGMPLSAVASSLIGPRSQYATAASRLHSRIDVAWHPIGRP